MKIVHLVLAGAIGAALVLPASAAAPRPSDVPPLIKQIKDKDAKKRAEAAKELGHIGSVKSSLVKDAIPSLLEAAKDKDANVRVEALTALSRIGAEPTKVVPLLVDSLKSKDQKLAVAAAQGLGMYGSDAEDALPELKKVAEDNQVPKNRKEAEMKFTREELAKRRAIGQAVGQAMQAIRGAKN